MSTEYDERSGRQKEISTERVHHIIHEYLGMRKLCAMWVPCELTFDQKQRRVDDSEQYLKMIKRKKPEFLHRYVTTDETVISLRSLIYSHPFGLRNASSFTVFSRSGP
ncbi:hypothetical protein GWI33_007202 [Rhynchophorus ferrugineus]|uniref:Uncharacterized protein n=1 Tax=Rhynchophorus ferrugineus TaxID=354439 RepID=A0A834IEX7_RHYFE|nr:hypothetical protein GWI33_007202 [Rhynchophorus ferrugineus]